MRHVVRDKVLRDMADDSGLEDTHTVANPRGGYTESTEYSTHRAARAAPPLLHAGEHTGLQQTREHTEASDDAHTTAAERHNTRSPLRGHSS